MAGFAALNPAYTKGGNHARIARHFYWNELMTRNVEGAKKFYADTSGWSFDAMPMPGGGGTYWVAKIGGEPVAGILDITPRISAPESWMPDLAVDHVETRG